MATSRKSKDDNVPSPLLCDAWIELRGGLGRYCLRPAVRPDGQQHEGDGGHHTVRTKCKNHSHLEPLRTASVEVPDGSNKQLKMF